VTHSLLNAWDYLYKANDDWYDRAYDGFMQTLYRAEITPTQAMLNGREFERLVSDVFFDRPIDCAHKWIEGAGEIVGIIKENCTIEQAKG